MNLYEIATQYQVDCEKLQELDLDDQTLTDTLEGLSGTLEAKAQATAVVVRNLESMAEQIKQAEDAMASRRKAIENRARSIRSYVLRCMQKAGISKIESPLFRISIKKNPPAVEVDSAVLIPDEYWTQPPPPPAQLDKVKIKQDIQAGIEIPGVHLEQEKRIDIK